MFFKKKVFLVILLAVTITSYGQKIKYKELFVLLNAKQYDQAEPFLKRYLPENMDNPNALLFMGYIYEEKALANDVLTELEKINNNTDSAILFFDLAYKEIDEKELKKNDEYYQMYSRRDLRTGKFGLKLSDVQFDLEKRSKFLKDRQQRIAELHVLFNKTQKLYYNCEHLYKSISERYKDRLDLLLRSDAILKSDLGRLARRYDSLQIAFNDYTTQLASLGKTGHNQEFDVQEIEGFRHEGFAQVDFVADEIRIWDFKRWSLVHLDIIESEMDPIRAALVEIDANLNALREKVRKDSVDVTKDLADILKKTDKLTLKKHDPNPMPYDVFQLKAQEIIYGSYLSQTSKTRDSADLKLKQVMLRRDVKLLSRIDSVASIIDKRSIDKDIEYYKHFVTNAYGSASVLKSLIKTTGDFAVSEKQRKSVAIASIDVALNWIIDGSDSIPVSENVKSKKFMPLAIIPNQYTFGITLTDTVGAYLYAISPSHKVTTKGIISLDTAYRKEFSSVIRGLGAPGENDNFYAAIYSFKRVDNKVPVTVYKVTSSGANWSRLFYFEGLPEQFTYNKDAKTLAIKVTGETGSRIVTINNDGKEIGNN